MVPIFALLEQDSPTKGPSMTYCQPIIPSCGGCSRFRHTKRLQTKESGNFSVENGLRVNIKGILG